MRLIRAYGAALMLALAVPVQAGTQGPEVVTLPSGLMAELYEMLTDETGPVPVRRFRFVAPDFATPESFEAVMADLAYLCAEIALPRLAEADPMPGRVIVSLADQPSEFGKFNPDVIQVFEAYDIENGTCIWEMF